MVAAGLAAATVTSHAQSASATISGVPAGSSFAYTITLKNTGTIALNSFWYAWTTAGNNLQTDPTNAANSLGWANTLSGNSIMWINGSGTALAPGASATFTFVSTTSPSAITTRPSGESVAYVEGIDFSQGSPGDSTAVFSPTLSSGSLAPVITEQPKSQTVLTNATVTFSVTASNATSYQWQSNSIAILGQTNDSLTLSNVVTADSATYRVVVSNPTDSVTSSNAVLTVTEPTPVTKEKLTVTINPAKSGAVSPNLNGKTLLVNHSYAVRAMAGKGQAFTNWSGIVQSDNPSLTFVMPGISNATLTANFIPSPFANNGVAGAYAGLFWDTNNPSNETSGGFSATVADNGVIAGQVKIAGVTTAFATTLYANGSATLTLPRHGQDSLVLTLQVDLSGLETITGTVADANNTFSAQLTAYRAGFSASSPATDFEGHYTWAMPAPTGVAPAGNSYGTAMIAAAGGVQLGLNLGDGTITTASGALSKNGLMPLYVSLYNGQGSLLAWLSFVKTSGRLSINGAFWFKNGIALSKMDASGNPVPLTIKTGPYPDGFTLTNLSLLMAAYVAEGKGTNALDATNVAIQISGADLTNSITNSIAVNSSGIGGSKASTAVNISDKTGLFSGSFKDAVSGATVLYHGAVLQPLQAGYGFFIDGGLSGAVIIEAASELLPGVTAANVQVSPEFNQAGNVLIADQWNNRVIEATPSGRIIWSFGLGPIDFSSNSIIGCNDAERVGDYTLMAGTGDPPGVIPQSVNGSIDNRILLVDPTGNVVWQYGQFGQAGDGSDLLNAPVQCTFAPGFKIFITDQGNNRIIEVNYNKEIVWQYPGANTNASDQLNGPNAAELLANGHVLIADQGNSRALEVTSADEIVNTFTAGGTVNTVAFASRLPNGHTLLTDAGNARIVEVDANDHIVWQYLITNNAPMSIAVPMPTRAVRLRDGDTLISDQLNNRVIRINSAGKILADYGLPLDGGTFTGGSTDLLIGDNVGYNLYSTQAGLYSPYDAKIIGDYTGLTLPGAAPAPASSPAPVSMGGY